MHRMIKYTFRIVYDINNDTIKVARMVIYTHLKYCV